jgi:hypothetical protein
MKKQEYNDKDEDVQYCDADVLKQFDADGKAKDSGASADLEFATYKKQESMDLMDFISKSDFSTVGGQNNAREEKKVEENPN